MKIAFICDTGTGLTPNELEEIGVYGVPLQITVDKETKLEGEEINVDQVYALMEEGKLLKTSLASARKCENLFERLKNEGYEMIFAIPICSGLSGTINLMRMSADQIGLQFDYFDCHCTATLELYMCIRAKELYEEGKSIGEIKMLLNDICDKANTLIVPDDLDHLRRGGRLTPIASAVGGLLKIKPILEINKRTSGKIDVVEKVRTMPKATQRTIDIMKKQISNDGKNYSITVAHVLCEDRAQELMMKYKEVFPKAECKIIKLVSVVGIHTGIGCLAIQYFEMK